MLHHTLRWSFSLAACMMFALALAGCSEDASNDRTVPPADRTPDTTGTPDPAAPSDATSTPMQDNADDTSAAPDTDQATPVVAYPLDVCLVSDEALGSMGEPIVLVHEGQEVKLCCKGCIRRFNSDPAKFIGKLSATE